MAINKTMRLMLKALSYPDIDVRKTYQLQRSAQNAAAKIRPDETESSTQDFSMVLEDRELLVRLYRPQTLIGKSLLLFFHGGGWVTENVDTYNKVCKNLADATNCRVASVEYSLAPEKPFPHGVEDCYAIAKEVLTNPLMFATNADEVVLIGDSAGGNLAAVVSLLARDRKEFAVAKQILIYPATYNDHSETSPYESVRTNGTDYLLTSKRICEYMDLYAASQEDRKSPYFAPLLAEDLSNQPKTLVITAEYDPLRDEGEAYARALKKAGNDVLLHRMPDALHAFFQLDAHFPHVQQAFCWINEFLSEDLSHE